MSGTKRISALTELASGSVDEDDILAIVDMSQASVTDKTKHVKVKNLIAVGGRLEIDSFAELATKFVSASPSSTQQIAATGDIVIWREKGFRYQCVTSGEHFDYTGSGGLKWKVLPISDGKWNVLAFGAVGSGVSDDTAAIALALTAAATNRDKVVIPCGATCLVTPQSNAQALTLPDGVYIEIEAGAEIVVDTDDADDPNTSVNWDGILVTGARSYRSGVIGPGNIRYDGGSRNNAAAIAVRNNASMVDIIGVKIKSTIASGIVIEGDVSSPYNTDCRVMRCDISDTVRHGVYISGAQNNIVKFNRFENTNLESVALRNASENDVSENYFKGNGTTYPNHAVALAQPPSGVYTQKKIKIQNNRFEDIPGAFFYGQGLGNILLDSDISGNEGTAMLAGSSHAFMFYRLKNCRIRNNVVEGGRNRAYMFYGCTNNDFVGNVAREVNSENNTIGAVVFAEYVDSADSSTTASTGNKVDKNTIIDERGSPLHVYGIQFLSNCYPNRIGTNYISGLTSSKYVTADSWSNFDLLTGKDRAWYKVDIPSGDTSSTQIPVIADTFADIATERGWLKSIHLIARQTITSGTITVTLYKNGSAWKSIVLTGNGSVTVASTYYAPETDSIVAGDVLTAFISASSVVTGTAVDVLFRASFAN